MVLVQTTTTTTTMRYEKRQREWEEMGEKGGRKGQLGIFSAPPSMNGGRRGRRRIERGRKGSRVLGEGMWRFLLLALNPLQGRRRRGIGGRMRKGGGKKKLWEV